MTLEMVFWDVQHGDAAYLKTPNNTHIVQDLGTGSYDRGSETFSPLLHLKQNWGVDRLDQVIITHPHKDHIDDIHNFGELNPYAFDIPVISGVLRILCVTNRRGVSAGNVEVFSKEV